MKYVEYPLSPLLKPFVTRVWEFEMDVPMGDVIHQPDCCTATTHFMFNLKPPFKTRRGDQLIQANITNLITPLTKPVINILEGAHLHIGVEFTLTGFHRLWQIPLYAINSSDTVLYDLQAVIGPEARRVYNQLGEAQTTVQRFDLMEKFLLRHINSKPTKAGLVEGVEQLVKKEPESVLIDKLLKQLYCSESTLLRHFNEQLGISPKTYLRIQRFQRVRNQLLEKTDWRWQTGFVHVDYYDQAHFIKEFVAFSGRSPSRYKTSMNEVEAFFSKCFH
ncbi:AraC family transcriptional regulator [Spirosoma sp. BT702]|uniref:AraC family transcriptional regulator n=1 Tax=Spirosoma profusum TaxID=2771354 RepID=A0A927AWT2_9BACT|nr:helix-turn-helix domain-containing protein [Spirosoma profusum]MBD2705837.1 AraC family transcriptional regulator [Spirosoma profusum]